MIEKESFIYSDCNKIIDKNFFNFTTKNLEPASIINVPIKTLNGKIIGILGVDYVRATKIAKKEDFLFKIYETAIKNNCRIFIVIRFFKKKIIYCMLSTYCQESAEVKMNTFLRGQNFAQVKESAEFRSKKRA